MKRHTAIILAFVLAALTALSIGISWFTHRAEFYPFRCTTYTRYDLSRNEGKKLEFDVAQDLRFQNKNSGYLLINGQATDGDNISTLNRRIVLTEGEKIDYDTYRYQIAKTITSSTDTTSDNIFNALLAELTLDPSYLQLNIDKVDENTYLISGPLSYLFTCQRY
ncbi:FidL-like protein [Pantoea sp. FN060301]|uniref:FidL-like protein n=1 Tax=Pantoea sp. FN060301 TaxID=3420380 RepID=UPI003D1741A5